MPRKKYRNVVCCVGQQKKRASPRLLDMISESGIKSFPTGKKLEEKEEEEEENPGQVNLLCFFQLICQKFVYLSNFQGWILLAPSQLKEWKGNWDTWFREKDLSTNSNFMATIFVFVYLLTTIYLFWCCVFVCVFWKGRFSNTAWKNKKGACKNAVFKQVHIIFSFLLPFFINPQFLQMVQMSDLGFIS